MLKLVFLILLGSKMSLMGLRSIQAQLPRNTQVMICILFKRNTAYALLLEVLHLQYTIL